MDEEKELNLREDAPEEFEAEPSAPEKVSNDSDPEQTPIKRSFIVNKDNELKYEQKVFEKKPSKNIVWIIVLLLILGVGGYFGKQYHILTKIRSIFQPAPVATPAPVPSPSPAEIKPVLNRSDWSLEVLNGSGVTGLAKKIADKVTALGYPVVKTGNADKSSYTVTQLLVKKDLMEKVDLVIADLKDVIKIGTVAGELKEGTASARIIIGKDSI